MRPGPRLALALLVLAPLAAAAAQSEKASPTPLLDYASEQPLPKQPFGDLSDKRRASLEHELARHPPPAREECGQTLGRSRFAELYVNLASARASLGDYQGAVVAYEDALACEPRAASLQESLAAELFHSGRLVEARAAAERGRAIDAEVAALDSMLAQLDLIEERWADAVARLRTLAVTETDPERTQYWLCFLWLAQRRAGVAKPDLPTSRIADGTWPAPILDALRGRESESDVVDEIRDEDDDTRRREELVEALYYIGQSRLAAGETQIARRYFAATVNLKVLYFIEHHMALAELKKMRAAARN